MMFFRLSTLLVLYACTCDAIQVKPSYGPPPQRLPHREYGVPQQMPFREYGPPALKYGPPKLNFIGGGSSSGLYEQIKNHYGAPKPFYGPPHKISQQHGPPAQQYGPPPPSQQYGPPPQQHGPPSKPGNTYGPPPLKLQKPISSYGPPKSQYGPPPPQALPLFQPAPQFSTAHQPASSYGPPPSGPLNIPPKQIFGPPPPNYGPPPLPNFNQKPDTTIILQAGQNSQSQHQQQQQVQVQIDATGHTHSVAGSQGPFHTACDGWKPIPAPAGSYIENNHIETQTGYSQVAQVQAHDTQSSGFSTTQHTSSGPAVGLSTGFGVTGAGSSHLAGGSNSGSNSIIDGLSDEQLVAVALQSSTFDADNSAHHHDNSPPTGPAGDFNDHSINSIDTEALQLSLGSIDDSYSKPPIDAFAPGSKYSQHFNQQSHLQNHAHNSFGIGRPSINLGPLSPPNNKYGPPPSRPNGNFGPPPPPNNNFVPPPPTSNYGPPLPPTGNYGAPPPPLHAGNYAPSASSAPGFQAFGHHHHKTQTGLSIQYGKQSGNLGPFPPHGGTQPSKPVAYRPPVPPGLFETIGATVQHLDKFGVKPQLQAPTYIPPAANELPQTGPGNLNIEYGAPRHPQQGLPQHIIEQQLPQPRPPQVFVQIENQQNSHHQQQFTNNHIEYGAPPLPQSQYIPPQQSQQQYLPPTDIKEQQQFNGGASFTSSGVSHFDNTAFASNQYNHEMVQIQALPLQQEQARFHDCGHGPNLVGGGNFNFQQHQYSSNGGTSISQSIPVAEQHTQFVSGPATSYGPPPSGGNELDHVAYASETSQATAFPDGTNAQGLPGLEGLNVLSAQKSEAIHFSSQQTKNNNNYQIHLVEGEQQPEANHEEILSADLLQTILNAVEKPQPQHQPLPANHKAESRSDIDINEETIEAEDDDEPEVVVQETKNIEVKVHPNDEQSIETDADIKEIKPIVVKEENEAKH